jgi:hypothetical protein
MIWRTRRAPRWSVGTAARPRPLRGSAWHYERAPWCHWDLLRQRRHWDLLRQRPPLNHTARGCVDLAFEPHQMSERRRVRSAWCGPQYRSRRYRRGHRWRYRWHELLWLIRILWLRRIRRRCRHVICWSCATTRHNSQTYNEPEHGSCYTVRQVATLSQNGYRSQLLRRAPCVVCRVLHNARCVSCVVRHVSCVVCVVYRASSAICILVCLGSCGQSVGRACVLSGCRSGGRVGGWSDDRSHSISPRPKVRGLRSDV